MQELEEEQRKYIAAKSKEYEMERAAKQKAAEERERELEEARLKKLAEDAKRAAEDEKRRKRILIFGTVFILLLIIVGSIWVIIARQQEQYNKNINNCVIFILNHVSIEVSLHKGDTYSMESLLTGDYDYNEYRLIGFTRYRPMVNEIGYGEVAWLLDSYLEAYPESSIINNSIEYLLNDYTYYYPVYALDNRF